MSVAPTVSSKLDPDYRKVRPVNTLFKGTRRRHVITHNPNKVVPGEDPINIPKLQANSCLVPGSLHLLFDFVNKNAKSWFKNNLARGLVERLQVKMGGETIFDDGAEDVFETYKDLWRSTKERSEMVEYDVANENTRKLMSKDDSGAASGDAAKVADGLIYKVYSTKQKICVDKILGDHGLYAPYSMTNDMQYILTIASADKVMVAQTSESVAGFSLENLEIEYEVLESEDTAAAITSAYSIGKSLAYDHVTRMKTVVWDKDTTLINETINLPRQSLKAIVLLFRSGATRADNEEFVYPNISSVKVTVEGTPNQVYSQGIPKSRFFSEAQRVFSRHEPDQFLTLKSFFKNHFCLAVDMRSVEDGAVYGSGKRLVSTQDGILLEIAKTATTANVLCDIFVLSDALLQIVNNSFSKVMV